MVSASRWSHAELGRFERFLAIGIIAVVCAVFLHRANNLQVEVERVGMLTTLSSLQSSLTLQAAVHLVQQDPRALLLMEGSNPFTGTRQDSHNRPGTTKDDTTTPGSPVLALEQPSNYLGALERPDPWRIPGGSWYFDETERVLVYRVRHEEYFETTLPGPKRARFAVRLVFDDENANHRFDPGIDAVQALKLQAVEPFRWLDDGSAAVGR